MDASTLARCTFEDLELEDAEWSDCRLTDCEFRGVKAISWWMERITFERGRWENVEVESGEWVHVTFREVKLDGLTVGDLAARNSYHVECTLVGGEWPEGVHEKSGRRKTLE